MFCNKFASKSQKLNKQVKMKSLSSSPAVQKINIVNVCSSTKRLSVSCCFLRVDYHKLKRRLVCLSVKTWMGFEWGRCGPVEMDYVYIFSGIVTCHTWANHSLYHCLDQGMQPNPCVRVCMRNFFNRNRLLGFHLIIVSNNQCPTAWTIDKTVTTLNWSISSFFLPLMCFWLLNCSVFVFRL